MVRRCARVYRGCDERLVAGALPIFNAKNRQSLPIPCHRLTHTFAKRHLREDQEWLAATEEWEREGQGASGTARPRMISRWCAVRRAGAFLGTCWRGIAGSGGITTRSARCAASSSGTLGCSAHRLCGSARAPMAAHRAGFVSSY